MFVFQIQDQRNMKSKAKNLGFFFSPLACHALIFGFAALFATVYVHALVFDTCCINIVYATMYSCKASQISLHNCKYVCVQGKCTVWFCGCSSCSSPFLLFFLSPSNAAKCCNVCLLWSLDSLLLEMNLEAVIATSLLSWFWFTLETRGVKGPPWRLWKDWRHAWIPGSKLSLDGWPSVVREEHMDWTPNE